MDWEPPGRPRSTRIIGVEEVHKNMIGLTANLADLAVTPGSMYAIVNIIFGMIL